MKRKIANNLALIAVLGLIAMGRIYLISSKGLRIAHTALVVEVVSITLTYFAATILNLRVLVPRLLLRNRFTAYLLSLLTLAIIFIAVEIGFERLFIDYYHLSPGRDLYFSEDSILFFEILSGIAVYFISVAGTAIVIFMRLWKQSGARIRDLEEQSARSELEKVRTRIDSGALFDTLEKAEGIVCRSPVEASGMLMKLSKSLRLQLYESEHKRHTAPEKLPAHMFNLSSPLLNLLTEKRYRGLRHLLMIMVFTLILSSNLDGTWSSLLFMLPLSLSIYLIPIYFSIYVLMPKLMMRNRMSAYLISVTLSALVIAIPMQLTYFKGITDSNGYNEQFAFSFWDFSVWMQVLYTITNTIKIGFPMVSVHVFILFQHWVRNERHIAELEAARMRSELEQLQNQVNPHFLFNMLNNIIVLTKKNPDEAANVLHKLSNMLQYQFRGFTKQSIRLGDDIRFLTDYLNLEKLRRDNFEFSITANNGVEELSLPPLLFIPFVENAVKHNNDNRNLSFVRLRFGIENDNLCFGCINSKPLRPMRKDEVGGLGLPNVRRRLDLLYGDRHCLAISENETTYTIELSIELKNKQI
jgi:sensor histidine kinase YesM